MSFACSLDDSSCVAKACSCCYTRGRGGTTRVALDLKDSSESAGGCGDAAFNGLLVLGYVGLTRISAADVVAAAAEPHQPAARTCVGTPQSEHPFLPTELYQT